MLLSGGIPQASFKDLAHAWGREKGFHTVLTSSVCERWGEVERKRRSDLGRTLSTQDKAAFKEKLQKWRKESNSVQQEALVEAVEQAVPEVLVDPTAAKDKETEATETENNVGNLEDAADNFDVTEETKIGAVGQTDNNEGELEEDSVKIAEEAPVKSGGTKKRAGQKKKRKY